MKSNVISMERYLWRRLQKTYLHVLENEAPNTRELNEVAQKWKQVYDMEHGQ
jgi:hypothetical protein